MESGTNFGTKFSQPSNAERAPAAESSATQAEVVSLQREGRELVAKVQAVEADGNRARRRMWRAGQVGCYSCAVFYRERLHEASAQLEHLSERVASVTRRTQVVLQGVEAER